MSAPAGIRLRERAWDALTRAADPLTAPQLGDAVNITSGAALTFLAEWAATGQVERRPDLTSTSPFADTYATPRPARPPRQEPHHAHHSREARARQPHRPGGPQ